MRNHQQQQRKLARSNEVRSRDRGIGLQLRAVARRNDPNWPPVSIFEDAPSNSQYVFLGVIQDSVELGRWAIEALTENFDSPALRKLASCAYVSTCMAEARELLHEVFEELILPPVTPENIEKLATINSSCLSLEQWNSGLNCEARGQYDAVLQYYFRGRYQRVEVIVNKVGEIEPERLYKLYREDFYEDIIEDYEGSLRITIEPYGREDYAASEMAVAEVTRIIQICLREYLRGHRDERTMNAPAFEDLASR